RANPDLYKVLSFLLLCCTAQQVFFPYIIIYIEVFLGISNYAIVLAVVLVLAAVMSVIGGRLVDRFGAKPFFFIFNGIFALGLALMYVNGHFADTAGTGSLIFLMAAGTLMIGGNMSLMMAFAATIRNYTPPAKRGLYNGIRLVFQVGVPMIIGPFIGARIIVDSPATYVDDFGVLQSVPNPNIFIGALVVALLLFIPMGILAKGLSTQYFD
ncbi:MAG: MFS transporter, partial [Promicromonosporaceae bacterium]|nr:MFS transporter [Promicromonosporaceae bacterium]